MSKRRPFDLYCTHAGMTESLLSWVDVWGDVAEPCVGEGHISKLLAGSPDIKRVVTNDIDPTHQAMFHNDATRPDAAIWQQGFNWVVTNPPFNRAAEILPIAFERARIGVAFLLRLSFLEPCPNRGTWLQEHLTQMSHLIIFGQPRPSFTGTGTDSVTTAWMVWRKSKVVNGVNLSFVTGWNHARER